MSFLSPFFKTLKMFAYIATSLVLEFILPIVPALVVITVLVITDRMKALESLRHQQIKYDTSRARRRTLKKWTEYMIAIFVTHYIGTHYLPSLQLGLLTDLLNEYPYCLYGLITLEIIGIELSSIAKHSENLGQSNSYWLALYNFIKVPKLFINKSIDKVKDIINKKK